MIITLTSLPRGNGKQFTKPVSCKRCGKPITKSKGKNHEFALCGGCLKK